MTRKEARQTVGVSRSLFAEILARGLLNRVGIGVCRRNPRAAAGTDGLYLRTEVEALAARIAWRGRGKRFALFGEGRRYAVNTQPL